MRENYKKQKILKLKTAECQQPCYHLRSELTRTELYLKGGNGWQIDFESENDNHQLNKSIFVCSIEELFRVLSILHLQNTPLQT